MATNATILSSRKGGDGFFGKVSSGIGDAIGTIARDLGPIWAAKELKLQQFDQLDNSTFDPRTAKPRLDDKRATTSDSAVEQADNIAGFDRTSVMIVGGGLLLAAVVFFIARK